MVLYYHVVIERVYSCYVITKECNVCYIVTESKLIGVSYTEECTF